jgi:hypothetical protein
MSRTAFTAAAATAAAFLAGCGASEPGSTRNLGAVKYEAALAASREALSQHFSILPSEPGSGTLKSRPKAVSAGAGGLIGFTTTGRRETATLRLLREGNQVIAHLAVTVEQQGNPVYRSMPQPDREYSSVPNLTPAQEDAATTPDQNDVWRAVGRNQALERTILTDIYRALNPPAKGKP